MARSSLATASERLTDACYAASWEEIQEALTLVIVRSQETGLHIAERRYGRRASKLHMSADDCHKSESLHASPSCVRLSEPASRDSQKAWSGHLQLFSSRLHLSVASLSLDSSGRRPLALSRSDLNVDGPPTYRPDLSEITGFLVDLDGTMCAGHISNLHSPDGYWRLLASPASPSQYAAGTTRRACCPVRATSTRGCSRHRSNSSSSQTQAPSPPRPSKANLRPSRTTCIASLWGRTTFSRRLRLVGCANNFAPAPSRSPSSCHVQCRISPLRPSHPPPCPNTHVADAGRPHALQDPERCQGSCHLRR